MAIIFGLAAAITYGAADFLGGLVSRRNDVFAVVLLSQAIGSLLLVVAVPFFFDTPVTAEALIWGGAAGVAGGFGVLCFYRALAVGRMSAVAPVTAVEAASIPVLYGLLTGERPTSLALVGVAVALVAVGLVSAAPDATAAQIERPRRMPPGLMLGLLAGLGFGLFFILLGRAGDAPGLWPLVAARGGSLTLVAVAALVRRTPLRPAPGSWGGIAGAGLLDVAANLFYVFAARTGLLTIAAVLTSMYPAMTVLLARAVLHERLVRIQVAGVAVAAVAIVMLTFG